jgi:hypothetical protein
MKRIIVLLLLVLALPGAAWARYLWFNNARGTVSGSDTGIVSKGSQLVFCLGIVPPDGHSLGSITFSTGALLSGSLETGGTFAASGSIFAVIGKGNYGEPKGTIFSGNFIGPITWTLISKTGDKLVFKLHGDLYGQVYTGRMIAAETTQVIVTTEEQIAQGIGHIETGKFVVSP